MDAVDDGSPRRGPVFVAGLAHSGKTPLRIALDESEEIAFERHSHHWLSLRRRARDLSAHAQRAQLFDAILADGGARRLVVDEDELRRSFVDEGPPVFDALMGLLHEAHARSKGASRWGVQIGRVELVAAELLSSLPGSFVVHMVRHPEHQLAFGKPTPGIIGWRSGVWMDSAVAGAGLQRSLPGRYLMVSHEELVSQPEETLERVCRFIGIDRTPAMIDALIDAVGRKADPPVLSMGRRSFIAARTRVIATQLGYVDRALAGRPALLESAGFMAWRLLGRRWITRRESRPGSKGKP